MYRIASLSIAMLCALGMQPNLSVAGTVIGGSDLLSASYHAQLEAWLGEGEIDLTNIFDKAAGDNSNSFHAAVDGKGRTISLIEVIGGVPETPVVIGGYNPLSWNIVSGYHTPAVRDAFIFNLANSEVRYQNPTNFVGQYQTANISAFGPTFGGGHDLNVKHDLTSGFAFSYSYGTETGGVATGYSQGIAGSAGANSDSLTFGRIEVFTISPASATAAPEPASLAIWGLGAIGMTLGAARRRKLTGVPTNRKSTEV